MFQFHKVRLKVNPVVLPLKVLKEFQFHKVRLKEQGKSSKMKVIVVSIP